MNKTKNKWVVSAASAALVASAIVPVASAASFSDIENNDHKEAILALAEAGIISGYTDGTFRPNAIVTRGNVAKLLGKWLVSEGYEIPEDYNTVERFTDLPVDSADQELVKYAALVKDAGVFKGSNDQLMQANNMSREQMAVVLVRALKTVYNVDLVADYKAADFESKITDLDKANADENREAIIALEFAEITKVTAFNPKNSVTRGQFASFLHRAITNVAPADVKVESVTAVNGTLTVKLAEKAEAVDVKDFTVTQAINGGEAKEVTPSKAELAEDGKTVTLTVDKVAAQETTEQSVVYTVNEVAAPAFAVEASTLAVTSVTAINGKELVVKFNAAVDKSSVITTGTPDTVKTGVVTVTRTSTDSHGSDVAADLSDTGTKATLSEDGKTLTITAGTSKFFKGNYDVKVANAVKKDTLDKMENFYSKFTANDIVGPTVTDVKYNVASDKFEVTLSEPIDAKTGEVLRVNGQPVTAGFDAVTAPTTKLTVARPADVKPGTTASIYIAGLKDASGNLMTAYTGNVDVTQDTAALAVSEMKQVSNKVVRVTFNKKLDSASNTKITGNKTDNGLVVTKSDGTVTEQYTVTPTDAANNPDGNKYDITLNDATYANGNTEKFAITLTDKAFKGVSGTANSVVTQNITLTKDTVKPTVKSSNVSIDKESIEVVLDKAISSTIDGAKVKLRRDGAELTPVTAQLKAGTDNVLVVKTTDATALTGTKLKAGTYQVRLEAGAVKDLNDNSNDTVNAPTVTVGDNSTIDPAKATITDAGTNEFKITAPGTEKFTTASLNHTNFVLDGKTIPANSDITLNTARTEITVKLPDANSVNIAGKALLTASGLSFESGNPYATSSATVTVADNTPATLTSSALLGNTLELTFDEAIDASTLTSLADVLGDLVISSSAGTFADTNTDASATVAAGSSNKKIVITITPGTSNWAAVIAGSDLTVSTKQDTTTGKVTKLKDANGVLVKAPVKVSVTK